MTTRTIKTFTLAALIALMLGGAALDARAAGAADKKLDGLRARFEGRFARLRQYKDEGKVGETAAALIEAVKDSYMADRALAQLVQDENTDRAELYRLLAEKNKTTPQLIAERNAERNFQNARSGDYLKGKDGQWKRKK